MSKVIKPTQEDFERLKAEFLAQLESGKWGNGKVTFNADLSKCDRKATIYFSDLAWRKMQSLVEYFSSEVGWHGIAYRGTDESKDDYYITDIVTYPQEVTGATVTTDQKEYQDWLLSFDDDIYSHIRFQGHSHVNMGTSPSNVDWELYNGFLQNLKDDAFYIFMIWNKKQDKTVLLYDLKKNVLFETADVEIKIEDQSGFLTFMEDAKKKVKSKSSFSYPAYQKPAATSEPSAKQEPKKSDSKSKKNDKKYSSPNNYDYSMWDDSWDNEYDYYGYGRRRCYS